MTLKSIYIARHGYRANWLPLPHPPNPTGIDSDPPLAPYGVEQAKQLAGFLTSLPEFEQPQFILSSPFYRCVETAQPIVEMLSLTIVLERGVGEWYKKKRKIIPEPADYDTMKQFFPILADQKVWDRDNTVGIIPDLTGETEEDIFNRAKKFWQKFIPVFESKFPNIENILIITHAATKIALGMALLKRNNVFEYCDGDKNFLRAGTCSLDKYEKVNSEWELKMNGHCEFLTNGEEMNWSFHSRYEAGSDEELRAKKEEAEKKQLQEQELTEKIESEFIREKTPVTELASGADLLTSEQYEDFYVTIDLPAIGRSQNFEEPNNPEAAAANANIIKPSSQFQMTDINEDSIFVKLSNNNLSLDSEPDINDSINNLSIIDGNIYQTNWNKLVGTDLIFDDYGELIGRVTEHLTCNANAKIVAKETEKTKEEEEEVLEGGEGKEEKTGFLKKAIRYAKKKNLDTNV